MAGILYTDLFGEQPVTQTTSPNSNYTPGTSLSGVMNQANLIMGKYNIANKLGLNPSKIKQASPEMQNAAMNAVNSSSFNFDSPDFDPNAGRQEAYDRRYAEYMNLLGKSGKKRINVSRANREFEELFNNDWAAGEALRRDAHNTQARNARMNSIKQSFFDASARADEDVNRMYEEAGYTFDPATGKWSAPVKEVTPVKSNDYWNQQAQQYGFADMNAVAEWQRQNGLLDDGKFGQNSLDKWNELQAANQPYQKSILRDVFEDMPMIGSVVTGRDMIKDPTKTSIRSFVKTLGKDLMSATNPVLNAIRTGKALYDGVRGLWDRIPENKQGGTLIKRHQQGGSVQQGSDIQAQIKQLVQAASSGNQEAAQQIEQIMEAAKQGDQQALQIAQMIQAEIESVQSAKRGAKLNYIKSLKGDCPDGEEVVYFQKGGMICKACQKKHDKTIAEKGKKLNPIEEFKKARKHSGGGPIEEYMLNETTYPYDYYPMRVLVPKRKGNVLVTNPDETPRRVIIEGSRKLPSGEYTNDTVYFDNKKLMEQAINSSTYSQESPQNLRRDFGDVDYMGNKKENKTKNNFETYLLSLFQ